MFIETCRNHKCGKKYKVEEIHGNSLVGKERMEIRCPYCEDFYTKRTAGYFKVSKLTPEEESRL